MRLLLFVKIFTILILCNLNLAICQEEEPSSPLKQGKTIYPIKIGIFGGIQIPISPDELVNKPTTATKAVDKSLLNGLNGLGYGSTINFGAVVKYPLSKKINLGTNLEYFGWKGEYNCDCIDTVSRSNNSLTLVHLGIFLQYAIYRNLYVAPEISLNVFGAKATENSNRGILDFSKSYTRIGIGLGIGYEIDISSNMALDLFAKCQAPNLFLGSTNSINYKEAEALINSKSSRDESTIFIISFNIGLLYSL